MHSNLITPSVITYLFSSVTLSYFTENPGSLSFPILLQVEDVYGNVLEGLSKPENTMGNECGIVINSADISHHGTWTCKVFVVGNSLLGSKNVVVTSK